jgi:agmatinase
MSSSPTFALPSTFMGIGNSNSDAEYCVCGVPYDIGTSNRPGTRFGPAAIRTASRMLVDGDHPFHWVNPLDLDISDVGNLQIIQGDIIPSLILIEEQVSVFKHLITLGGDHTVTLPILRALSQKHGKIGLIHFDAHVDTWPDNYSGSPYGHGNPFYHAIVEGLIDPEKMVQIGIRSPVKKSVYDWTQNKGVYIWTAEEIHKMGTDVELVGDNIVQIMTESPIPVYLTMDIDCLDPAFAPGTGTPEFGGLNPWQVQTILRRLIGLNFIGMDVVEVSPPYDVSEITALAGATFVWEYLSLLALGKKENDGEIPF